MRRQRIVLLSPHPPLPPGSPGTPWAVPLAGPPTLSPSLPTPLPQHCPPPRTSTNPHYSFPGLPSTVHPSLSFPLSRALPVLSQFSTESPSRSMSHIHGRGGGQTGVIHCLITFILARCFPLQGLCWCQPHCLKRQLRSLCLRVNTDTIACTALTWDARPTNTHSRPVLCHACRQLHLHGRQAGQTAPCTMNEKATCSGFWFLRRLEC